MQNLLYNISQVLGITILHSLWQGLIIFIVLRLAMLLLPAAASTIKYRLSYTALVATLGWFIITLFNELGHYNWLSTTALQVSPLTLPAIINEVNAPANKLYFAIAQYMPLLTTLYIAGLVFNTVKLTLAWNSIYRIKQNVKDAGFKKTLAKLSVKLNLSKNVRAVFSEWVDVPCVTGIIKPVILLPIAITCQLSTHEIEAVLLHELAHVKRNDYLLNFIQQVIGILLFFNPFAKLITTAINKERENCCDDIVVHVTGSPFIYAQALLKLEENKQHQWQLALAATTKKYELLNRIERIMKTKTQTVNIRPVLITVLALTCAISSIAWLNPEIKNGKIVIKNAPAIKKIAAAISAPTPPAIDSAAPKAKRKKSITFKYDSDLSKTGGFTDTVINNKKYKIVVEDENGTKKEYNSLSELPDKDKNDFMGSSANLQFRTDSNTLVKLNNFYSSDVWKKQMEQAMKVSANVADQFNSPEWKKQQKAMVENSMKMAKKAYGPELKKLVESIAKSSAEGDNYYNSAEFKKQMEKVAKYYDSPAFKKQMNDIGKYYDSPEFKKQMNDIAKYYDSPKFKAQMNDIGKYYDSAEFKKQMEDMGKSFEDMGKAFDGKDTTNNKRIRDAIKREINGAKQRATKERKEKPEKKEQPEKQEQPEQKEAAANKDALDAPVIAATGKTYSHWSLTNSIGVPSDTIIDKHKGKAKLQEITIEEPIVKKKTKSYGIVIDEPLPAKKSKIEEVRIEEPLPAKPAKAQATTLDKVKPVKKAKVQEIVIEEPIPSKKP